MSDEPKPKDQKTAETEGASVEWSMPEPVFRSTEGISPLEKDKGGDFLELPPEDDIPTEMMGFASDEAATADDETPTSEPDAASPDEQHKQTVRVKEKPSRRHHKKKRSQSKLMTGLALAVGLVIGGVILATIYFLFR